MKTPTSSGNPFNGKGWLDRPLDLETCQRIHFTALHNGAHSTTHAFPQVAEQLEELRAIEQYYGPSVYLAHPHTVETIFEGVTVKVYQRIQALYVDRLSRSVQMVIRILKTMAEQAGAPSLNPEAIWAICAYLNEIRREQIEVTVEYEEVIWALVLLDLGVQAWIPNNSIRQMSAVVVIDESHDHVIGFRLCEAAHWNSAICLALYDALAAQRSPAALTPAGLRWVLPQHLSVMAPIPTSLEQLGQAIGIDVSLLTKRVTLATVIEENWRHTAPEAVQLRQLRLTFDAYLRRMHNYGPLRRSEERDRTFRGRLGYNRDPAWQFPALRLLLPEHDAQIDEHNEITYGGLHYTDELLALFPGASVMLRSSLQNAATVWVYLDGEVLCEAHARELRRADGSYRSRRPSV